MHRKWEKVFGNAETFGGSGCVTFCFDSCLNNASDKSHLSDHSVVTFGNATVQEDANTKIKCVVKKL